MNEKYPTFFLTWFNEFLQVPDLEIIVGIQPL